MHPISVIRLVRLVDRSPRLAGLDVTLVGHIVPRCNKPGNLPLLLGPRRDALAGNVGSPEGSSRVKAHLVYFDLKASSHLDDAGGPSWASRRFPRLRIVAMMNCAIHENSSCRRALLEKSCASG